MPPVRSLCYTRASVPCTSYRSSNLFRIPHALASISSDLLRNNQCPHRMLSTATSIAAPKAVRLWSCGGSPPGALFNIYDLYSIQTQVH
ncbi:hypothetical protein A0H81_04410 [Grifola frondosa]|uniref:Uncharacterized protein n=1 Tax=Grifola frondosa TaxID=5627 RepID=A0A1C7MEV4_GRIFR|nr:hypothetical protein A0H81_04410 [Grifola frondosa]